MDTTFEISFSKSSSINYRKAVVLAKKFSTYNADKDNPDFHRITISLQELRKKYNTFCSIWSFIQSWKSSRILVNGKSIDLAEVNKYLTILQCNEDYKNSVIPQNHCKINGHQTGFNCKHLREIDLSTPESSLYYSSRFSYWFQFGSFNESGQWVIDKQMIKDAILREVELKKVMLCEVFDSKNIDLALNKLQDIIDVENSDSWEVEYETSIIDNEIIKTPARINIKKREYYQVNYAGDVVKSSDNFSNENIKGKNRNIPIVTFDEIGGIKEIIQEIREIIELPIKYTELFQHLSVKPHKGILLSGSPGCGKTLIAKAIANEVKAHFISVNGPELLSKWFGESEENLRKVFREANELQPTIVFFDEIDSIAQSRSSEESLQIKSSIVNQLLTLMDGVEDYGQVRVVASTNRPELLDSAILRPGRFDYKLKIHKPTKQGCIEIFRIHAREMPITETLDYIKFGTLLEGLNGAEIAFIAREGAYNCLRRSLNIEEMIKCEQQCEINLKDLNINENDFLKALDRLKNEKEQLID